MLTRTLIAFFLTFYSKEVTVKAILVFIIIKAYGKKFL
jgi:hypothetical protein